MKDTKEKIVKVLLRVIRLAKLPIWDHTKVMLTVILVAWGKIAFFRLDDAQRWEARGSEVIQVVVLGSAFVLVVWLLNGVTNYCQYRQFPAYLKLLSTSRWAGRFLWYGVISLMTGLAILGALLGVGT